MLRNRKKILPSLPVASGGLELYAIFVDVVVVVVEDCLDAVDSATFAGFSIVVISSVSFSTTAMTTIGSFNSGSCIHAHIIYVVMPCVN